MTGGRFADRVALVSGSTQGLGRALLLEMADDGLAGAVVTGRNADRGEFVRDELITKGCEAIFVPAELDDADQLAALVATADERFGRIDHLANCGAVTDRGDVWDTTAEFWDWMMAVNVRAPFLLTQGVAEVARRNRQPASVVNVGSVAGYGGQDFITAYSVSKGALMTMTRSLAHQLMPPPDPGGDGEPRLDGHARRGRDPTHVPRRRRRLARTRRGRAPVRPPDQARRTRPHAGVRAERRRRPDDRRDHRLRPDRAGCGIRVGCRHPWTDWERS